MAINKNKINDNALKFIQKGQIKKAIKEYEKILAEDPSDVRTLLKKGDLLVRIGEKPEAVDTYLKVASTYSQQGFHLKSVAVFKQILKIDEGRIDVNLRLADEYQNLGIVSDAMTHLQVVADYYDQQGMARESLDIFRRIVDLDPENVASRIKLAELYSREGMVTEAVEEFTKAAEDLKNSNRIEDYIKVAERLIYHDSSNVLLIKELANIYLQRGDTKRALGKLQICFKADARDLETLNLLALAFQELNQLSKTVSVYKEMAKIYQDQGSPAEMQQVYRRVLEIVPDDPEARQALSGAGPAAVQGDVTLERSIPSTTQPTAPRLERTKPVIEEVPQEPIEELGPDAEQTAALEPEPEEPPPERPSPSLSEQSRETISRLLTETDVYIKYGLQNKAFEHLKKVFDLDPNNIEAHEKLKDLYTAAGQMEHAASELILLAHLASRIGRTEQARSYLQALFSFAPDHPEGLALAAQLDVEMPVSGDEEAAEEAVIHGAAASAPDDLQSGDEAVAIGAEPEADDLDIDVDDLAAEAPQQEDQESFLPAVDDLSEEEQGLFGADVEPTESRIGDQEVPAAPKAPARPAARKPEAVPSRLSRVRTQEAPAEDFDADDGGEASTMIADLDQLDPDSVLDLGEKKPRPVSIDPMADYGVGEVTADADLRTTGVYPKGGPEDYLKAEEPEEPAELSAVEEVAGDDILGEDDVIETGAPSRTATGDQQEPELIDLDGDEAFFEEEIPEHAALPPLPPPPPPPTEEEIADLEAGANQEGAANLGADQDSDSSEIEIGDAVEADDEPLGLNTGGGSDAGAFEESAAEAPTEAALLPPPPPLPSAKPEKPVAKAPATARPAPAPAAALEPEEDVELEDSLEEVDFFIQQNLLEEAGDALELLQASHPDHAGVKERQEKLAQLKKGAAPLPQVSVEEMKGSFDLAAELEKQVGNESAPLPLDEDFQYSVDDVFSEFKKGVEKVVEKEDSATHFDLGIAYKEMGLVDDAISEFGVAASDASRRPSSLTMVGLCFVEKGQYSEAINRFKDALHAPNIGEEQATAVYFEMGQAYELLKDLGEALFYFKKVYKRDPKFRDVSVKLQALMKSGAVSRNEPEDSKKPPASAGGNKISYM